MHNKKTLDKRLWIKVVIAVFVLFAGLSLLSGTLSAQVSPPPENPQSGSVGLEGTISSPPPTQSATISTPVSGRTYSELPITINGLCPQGTMVKIFSNNIFIGSVKCTNGSFSLQVDLFSGQNDLIARVYDDLDQAGPDSNSVRVTFNDTQFAAFGSRVSLTSNYAKLGANPKARLTWPIVLSGGTGPYALSVDWGDGKPFTLKSVSFPGNLDIDHIYDAAGIYRVVVKVTDANGTTGYLQLIGVANGSVGASSAKTGDSANGTTFVTKTKYPIAPTLLAIPLIAASFWLGRKYEVQVLRHRIEQSAQNEYNR